MFKECGKMLVSCFQSWVKQSRRRKPQCFGERQLSLDENCQRFAEFTEFPQTQ